MTNKIGDLLAHLDDPAVCERCSRDRTVATRLTHDRARFVSTRSEAAPSAEVQARLRGSVGVELRALRAEFGVSQWRLSARAGVARSTVERLESGRRRPTASMLASLVVAAPWSVPPRPEAPHAEQVAWLWRLIVAAGPDLVAETPGGLRRRSRRLRAAERVWRRQVARVHWQAAVAEETRRRALMAEMRQLAGARSAAAIERVLSRMGKY